MNLKKYAHDLPHGLAILLMYELPTLHIRLLEQFKNTVRYSNTGCGVLKRGVQNYKNQHNRRELLIFEIWINGIILVIK